MSPGEEAQKIADEIAANGYANMHVTISLGCEYCNSYDVNATVKKMPPQAAAESGEQ